MQTKCEVLKMFELVLVWYEGECMVSIINIIMVPKNLQVGNKFIVLVKISYLMGMSRVKNLCIPKFLFESKPL